MQDSINEKDLVKEACRELKADRIAIVVPRVKQWHGARVMHEQDFGTAAQLPPKAVTKNLGAKYVVDPGSLKPFVTIRKRIFTVVQAAGIPFLGGYAIPTDKVKEVKTALEAHVAEYEAAKADFVANYKNNVHNWALQHPEFQDQILESALSAETVGAKISASYLVGKLSALAGEEAQMEQEVEDLMTPILEEASEAAAEANKVFVFGKTEANYKLKERLVKIVSKLESWSFINGRLAEIVNVVLPIVKSLPAGKLEGLEFARAGMCLNFLSSRRLMTQILNGEQSLEILAHNLQLQKEGREPAPQPLKVAVPPQQNTPELIEDDFGDL